MKRVTEKDVQAYIKTMLKTNKAWASKGLQRIFRENQTAQEQSSERTIELNGIGFSGADSEILSSFARQMETGKTLSDKQMALVLRIMPRYWKQVKAFIPADKMEQIKASLQLSK